MSRRYDRVTIHAEYQEDFSSPTPGMQGKRAITWAFLPIDKKAERLAILWRWWAEDNTPESVNLDIG